jgi:hypothetical protein
MQPHPSAESPQIQPLQENPAAETARPGDPPAASNRLVHALEFLGGPAEAYRVGNWVFLRLLGICHLIAFASLWHQIDGLIGDNGILPATQWLQAVAQQLGTDRFWQAPTLCWLDVSQSFRHTLCLLGVGFSLAATVGIATRLTLGACWVLYLSLSIVGGLFFGYQWDALILEVTLFALFAAPTSWKPTGPRLARAPARAAIGALWWLLFRLMLLSGAVKLLSKDQLWSSFSALTVHFQTQPLPTPLAWWLHQLPPQVHTASCVAMFAIELGAPFLLLFGRLGRRTAALGFCGLMTLVALSGNYCFFNLLVFALGLCLLDNAFWPSALSAKPPAQNPATGVCGEPLRKPRLTLLKYALAGGFLLLLLWCSVLQTAVPLFQWRDVPAWANAPLRLIAPLRSVNSYGLFAVMTPTRPEIILEGSEDGRTWKEYSFKWKAGDTHKPLPIVAPYQPRLDWQMWFASLGELKHNPWFSNLLVRVLQGEPSVLALMADNPFPEKPPRYLRAALFQYKFTDSETRARTGDIWERDYRGDYCPPISLK